MAGGAPGMRIKKKSIKALALYFLCSCVPVFVVLYTLLFDPIADRRYKEQAERQTRAVFEQISQKMDALFQASHSIFTSNWFVRYNSDTGFFDDSFHIMRRIEICDELKMMVSSMQVAEDIIVVLPRKNTAISCTSWSPIDEYVSFYDTVSVGFEEDTGRAVPLVKHPEKHCIMTLHYMKSEKDYATVCVLVSRDLIAKYMENVETDNMLDVRILMGSEVLYEKKSGFAYEQVTISEDSFPFLNVSVGYERYYKYVFSARTGNLWLMIATTVIISALIAAFLYHRNNRPMKNLFQHLRVGVDYNPDEAYSSLYHFVENIRDENRALSAKNQRLIETLKNEIAFGMFTDPDYDFQNDSVCSLIPWLHDGLPFLMALIEGPCDDETLGRIAHECEKNRSFRVLGGERCVLLWFDGAEDAALQETRIDKRLLNALDKSARYCLSQILQDPHEIREAYLTLKKAISDAAPSELPVALQVEFVMKMQGSKFEECREILQNARNTYPPELFFAPMLRLADEYSIETAAVASEYAKQLARGAAGDAYVALISFASDICRAVSLNRGKSFAGTAEMIRAFIDENYTNPDMSIKMLSEAFDLGGTLISKIFKAHLGVSFSDYLLALRIKKAMELLRTSDCSVTSITESVGYVNYYSFKRAFLRYQGITPKEYRELKAE